MALMDFAHAKRLIRVNDECEFEVRGISLSDVAGLITRHQEAIDRVVAVIKTRNVLERTDEDTIADIIVQVVRESPHLAADIICSCSDEPEAYTVAYSLPLAVQIETLQAIGDLSFKDAAALKKFIADARRLLKGFLPPQADAAA